MELYFIEIYTVSPAMNNNEKLTSVVQTANGPIQGRIFSDGNGKSYGIYQGIPYAEPPINDLRFEKPLPHCRWSDVRLCTQFGNACPHVHDEYDSEPEVEYDEDCLYLNVFAPSEATDGTLLPVIFYVHGGGFAQHSAANYGAENICESLCSKELIVVTINYRLGVFGFASDPSSGHLGNYGLWDMKMALDWVVENIKKFHGDPSRITAMGHSAGACSVDLLGLSPQTRDEIKSLILLGASSYAAVQSTELQFERTKELANHIGWNNGKSITTDVPLMEFLKDQLEERFAWSVDGVEGQKLRGGIWFTPNIDFDFFPKSLEELRDEQPRIPVILGNADDEGLLFLSRLFEPKTEEEFAYLVSVMISADDFNDHERLQREAVEFYSGMEKDVLKRAVRFVGDAVICSAVGRRATELARRSHPTYFYRFDYFRDGSLPKLGEKLAYLGATHGSELRYILGKGVTTEYSPTEEDKKLQSLITKHIAEFVKTGNPNWKECEVKWENFTIVNPSAMTFSESEKSKMKKIPELLRMSEFWSKIIINKKN